MTLLAILLLARALDLGSTWVRSPDLKHELNPIIRHLGWFWTLVFNALACPIIFYTWSPWVTHLLIALSVAVTGWNVRQIWRGK